SSKAKQVWLGPLCVLAPFARRGCRNRHRCTRHRRVTERLEESCPRLQLVVWPAISRNTLPTTRFHRSPRHKPPAIAVPKDACSAQSREGPYTSDRESLAPPAGLRPSPWAYPQHSFPRAAQE